MSRNRVTPNPSTTALVQVNSVCAGRLSIRVAESLVWVDAAHYSGRFGSRHAGLAPGSGGSGGRVLDLLAVSPIRSLELVQPALDRPLAPAKVDQVPGDPCPDRGVRDAQVGELVPHGVTPTCGRGGGHSSRAASASARTSSARPRRVRRSIRTT